MALLEIAKMLQHCANTAIGQSIGENSSVTNSSTLKFSSNDLVELFEAMKDLFGKTTEFEISTNDSTITSSTRY